MARSIFISYRREDTAPFAGRLNDQLALELGDCAVFMDVDSIPLGTDFVEYIEREVAKCDVLLAVIGENWLGESGPESTRRIDDPNDFVRIEIAAALKRDIPVVPILIENTEVPGADRLPENLQPLSRRNGLRIRHESFKRDVQKLVSFLQSHLVFSDAEDRSAEQTRPAGHPTDRAVPATDVRNPMAGQNVAKSKGLAGVLLPWLVSLGISLALFTLLLPNRGDQPVNPNSEASDNRQGSINSTEFPSDVIEADGSEQFERDAEALRRGARFDISEAGSLTE